MVQCQIPLHVFWDATWFELDLLARQYHHRVEQEYDYTRLIMSSMSGEKPSKIIKLSRDSKATASTTTSKEDAQRILERRMKLKANMKNHE